MNLPLDMIDFQWLENSARLSLLGLVGVMSYYSKSYFYYFKDYRKADDELINQIGSISGNMSFTFVTHLLTGLLITTLLFKATLDWHYNPQAILLDIGLPLAALLFIFIQLFVFKNEKVLMIVRLKFLRPVSKLIYISCFGFALLNYVVGLELLQVEPSYSNILYGMIKIVFFSLLVPILYFRTLNDSLLFQEFTE